MKQLFKLIFVQFICVFGYSTTYYSDPTVGTMSNPGTSSQPWANLESIFNSGQTFNAGDIILLRNGNHGFPKINGVNTGYVNIQAQAGHSPVLDRIYIGNIDTTSYWKLSNLTVQTINISPFPISLITLYPSTSNIAIENCTIQSTNNTTTYSRNDWRTKTNNGVRAQGTNHIIQNNVISNVAVGLSIEASSTLVNNNLVQYFTIDGIRGLANDCIYQKNTVMDNIVVFTYDENHYDGFQAYTCCPVGSDTLKNVIIRQNTIINTSDTTRQWQGPMQGISCFDGFFENWTIENNLVIVDHWHGITLLGAINCRIINNTCVDPYDVSPIDSYDPQSTSVHGPPWVSIKAHKNGNPSYNNTIQNNIASALNNDTGIGTVSHNTLIVASSFYPNHFVNYLGLDYHLISASTAIDAGISNFAPYEDIDNLPRPQGYGFDTGAYEYSISVDTQYVSICNGENYSIGNSNYSSSGTYYDTLQANNGEDSVIVTFLTVNTTYNYTIFDTICNGQNYTVASSIYTQSGIYFDTLSTILTGCDSVQTTNLNVLSSSNSVLTENLCPENVYIYGDSTYLQNTTIFDTIISNNTCLFKQINVNYVQFNPNLTLSINADTIISNEPNSIYQWIDCNNNNTILGDTNQYFVPQQNGSYAVLIWGLSDCVDTSECVFITNVGLKKNVVNNKSAFKLYPNPNNGTFIIYLDSIKPLSTIKIYNQLGQEVFKSKITTKYNQINTNLTNGVYQIVLFDTKKMYVKRLVIN
jgi:hypothetical protein